MKIPAFFYGKLPVLENSLFVDFFVILIKINDQFYVCQLCIG